MTVTEPGTTGTRTRTGAGILVIAALLVAAAVGTAPSAGAAPSGTTSRSVTFSPPFAPATPDERQLHCDDGFARCTTRASATTQGATVLAEAVRTAPHVLDEQATWVHSSAGYAIRVTVPRGASRAELTATQSIGERTCHTVARPPGLGVAFGEARVDFTVHDQQGTEITRGTLGGPMTCYSFGIEIRRDWPVGTHRAWRRMDLTGVQGRELLLTVRPVAEASLYMPDHYRPAGEARARVAYQLDALTFDFY